MNVKKNRKHNTKRLVMLAFLVSIALVISLIEGMLPSFPAMPGAKLGLSNVAPLFALIVSGVADAYVVMTLKCLLSALISGGLSGLMYSLPSGIVSLSIEVLLFAFVFDKMSIAAISLVGAVVFNAVQTLMASLITGINLIAILPYFMLAGLLAGGFTGALTYFTVKKLPYSAYCAVNIENKNFEVETIDVQIQ